MLRSLDKYISVEMFSLWLIEFVLVAFVTSFLLTLQPGAINGPVHFLPHVADGAIGLALTISTVSVAIGLYRPEICLKARRFIANILVVGLLSFIAITALSVSRLLEFGQPHDGALVNLPVVEALIAWMACLAVTRLAFNAAMRRNVFSRRIMVVGGDTGAGRIQGVISAKEVGFCQLVGIVTPTALVAPVELRRRKIWAVVVAEEDEPSFAAQRRTECRERGVHVLSEAGFREMRLQALDVDRLSDDWLNSVSATRSDTLHRALDILMSLALLIATLPLMIITTLAIKLESDGPVFYGQERVGLNGRPFTLWKFRSMSVDAEVLGKPVWAAKNDPRVTRVGRFIRRTRIDELPQILNVLSGVMSFIGPRPERPVFVAHLAQSIPHYTDRAQVKPGITGWAQVNFPYGASIEDARKKLSYDLYYVKHRSLVLNMLIVVATVRVILFQEGSR